MIIHVTRDSVCMGDDTFDNSRDIEFDGNATVGRIIPELNGRAFFPSVSGNDVLWAVENSHRKRILEYYTKSAETEYMIGADVLLKDVCGDSPLLHCVYYANYRKR